MDKNTEIIDHTQIKVGDHLTITVTENQRGALREGHIIYEGAVTEAHVSGDYPWVTLTVPGSDAHSTVDLDTNYSTVKIERVKPSYPDGTVALVKTRSDYETPLVRLNGAWQSQVSGESYPFVADSEVIQVTPIGMLPSYQQKSDHDRLVEAALDDVDVMGYMRQGLKIAAIKELRQITSCGLKQAKDAVEDARVTSLL